MTFTENLPNSEGWYWYRRDEGEKKPIRVQKYMDGEDFWSPDIYKHTGQLLHTLKEDDHKYEFAGPIPEPKN